MCCRIFAAAFTRRGYATSAVTAVCRAAFVELGLERLEAATLPENVASQSLLRKLGFREEGYARQYLQIAGRRQDHLLFALLRSETDLVPPLRTDPVF